MGTLNALESRHNTRERDGPDHDLTEMNVTGMVRHLLVGSSLSIEPQSFDNDSNVLGG